jgi:hypothetical protein
MGGTAVLDAGQDQHLRALEHANRVRLARADMKRRIAAGELAAADVILDCPWEADNMSVSDILMSQKRWGRARCRRLLMAISIPENKCVGTLTERQRLALSAMLASTVKPVGTRINPNSSQAMPAMRAEALSAA